jgi:site-specific DNA recombinase
MKQGKTTCSGMRIRMDRLDGVVLDHLSERLLEPKRLQELLGGYLGSRLN